VSTQPFVIPYPFFSGETATKMNNQPILFYSTRCSHSQQIIQTLKGLKKENLCRMVSIDGKQRSELPPFLKTVPTLYNPETKDVYSGKDIYAYIAKPVTSRREVPTQQQPHVAAAQPTGSKLSAQGGNEGIREWSFAGSGFSDSYSDWSAPTKFVSDELHYTYIGNTQYTPIAAPEPETKQSYDGDKNGRNNDLTARLEQMQKQRDAEFAGPSRQ
jgi:hypothetical protein